METSELLEILGSGEDGKHQFKTDIVNETALAAEITAFSNSGGGRIFIGVSDDASPSGLGPDRLRGERGLNQLIPNVATNQVLPPVNVTTENVLLPTGLFIVVTVYDGIAKPYMDNQGAIWVKSGSDKRKVTSREELQRMFQSAGLVHGDEVPANGFTAADLDLEYFKQFYKREFTEELESTGIPLPRLVENMNLAKDGVLNIAGALLFAKTPQVRLPTFIVKAVSFPGVDITDSKYLDSKDIDGKLADVYSKCMSFLLINTRAVQGNRSFNSIGQPEIPREALEELVVNAFMHRDYFVSAPIRILIFSDRIEIISPGHLPNNLTIENIISGNSNIRNPVLVSFASKLLPYRGIGSGIRRALRAYPDLRFLDDRSNNCFIVTIVRNQ